MNNKKYQKVCKKMDHRGVSLMELLISMIILILIMVPLISNFIRSSKINSEAGKLQDYSNIAADIVEDLKIRSITETLSAAGYDYMRNGLTFNDVDLTYSRFSTSAPQENYYLGLVRGEKGIKYDVLLKLSSGSYEYDAGNHDGTLMNSYEMPDISAVDEDVNGMLFTRMYQDQVAGTFGIKDDPFNANDKLLDQIALDYYQAAAYAYAQEQFRLNEYAAYMQAVDEWTILYQEAVLEGTTLPVAPTEPVWTAASYSYCNVDNIKSWMSKMVKVALQDSIGSDGTVKTVITYQITYYCDWTKCVDADPVIAQEATWTIDKKTYGISVNKVYLYYQSFLFQDSEHSDEIHITNDMSRDIDVFLVNQEGNLPDSPVKVYRSGGRGAKIYTNLTATQIELDGASSGDAMVQHRIITSAAKDRIYSVNVSIYRFVEGAPEDKYKKENFLYSIDSNQDQ